MRLRQRRRVFCVGVASAIPLLNVALWIGIALRPPPPPPPVAWSLPRALLSALTPSSTPSASAAAPSAVATTPTTFASTAPSAAPRPIRHAAPSRPFKTPDRDIVNPWGGM